MTTCPFAGVGPSAHDMGAAVSNAAADNGVPQRGAPSPTGAQGVSWAQGMPGAPAAPTSARPHSLCCLCAARCWHAQDQLAAAPWPGVQHTVELLRFGD